MLSGRLRSGREAVTNKIIYKIYTRSEMSDEGVGNKRERKGRGDGMGGC